MKVMIVTIVGLLLFSTTALSELDEDDLDKIRLIVKEEVETGIQASETRMKEHVSQEIKSEVHPVNNTITEMDKRLADIFSMVIALMAPIAVVVGIPQIIVAMQGKDIKLQDSIIESQQKQIEDLIQEIESMKRQQQTVES